jgi:hypothetical protein
MMVASLRIEERAIIELKPHPALVKNGMLPSASKLVALESLGEAFFEQPLSITQDDLIVDGYARWALAHKQGRETLSCIQYQMTELQALERIIDSHRRPNLSQKWNDFSRISLALSLEPIFREKAREKQSVGGRDKLPPKLTEDEPFDCRKELARLAGVSTGNISKVRLILGSGIPRLVEEARCGAISIHAGWQIARLGPADQEIQLSRRRTHIRRKARIDKLIDLAAPVSNSVEASFEQIRLALRDLMTCERLSRWAHKMIELLIQMEHEI